MNLIKWADAVKERDGYRCTECGSTDRPEAHHILPRALGGENTLENGQTLCDDCHSRKHRGKLSPYALAGKPPAEKSTTIKINKHTLGWLRAIGAVTNKTQLDILDELIDAEEARLKEQGIL